MARKKGGKRRQQEDSDSDEKNAPNPSEIKTEGNDTSGLSRKQLRQQKLKARQALKQGKGEEGRNDGDVQGSDGSEDGIYDLISGKEAYGPGSDKEEDNQPQKKLTKKQLRRQKEKEEAEKRAAAAFADSDSDEEKDAPMEEEEDNQPQKKLTKKQLRRQKEKEDAEKRAAAAFADSDSDEEKDAPMEEEEDNQPQKKLTKKQLRRQKEKEEAEKRAAAAFADSDSDEEKKDAPMEEEEDNQPQKKLTKKQLRRQKEKEEAEKRAAAAAFADSDSGDEKDAPMEEDSEDEVEIPQPVKKKKVKKGKRKKASAVAYESDEENEVQVEISDEEIPQPLDKKKKKKGKKKDKGKKTLAAAFESEEESEAMIDVSDDDAVEIPQPVNKKKKKKKKDKKKDKGTTAFESDEDIEAKVSDTEECLVEEVQSMSIQDKEDGKAKKKKDKKDKKKKDNSNNGDGNDGEANISAAEKAEAKAKKKAERKARKEAKEAEQARKMAGVDDGEKQDANDDVVMYGAPGDEAWTDKSAAILEAEKNKKNGEDLSLIYGKDGKKLSNRERKRLLKERQAAERLADYEKQAMKASEEGAQFACSQTAISNDDPQWQNSLDINIPSFSISAAGKVLFQDATLNIAHGKRLGLIGPNGRGKSTLLKMIASNDLKLPPRVDFLYVEQEVVADNTPAVEAVLRADKRSWALIEEEKELTHAIDSGDEDPKKLARLQEVYNELSSLGSDSSEAKARRILYGLGFDVEMQTKPTKMFSGGWRMRISLARALFIEPTLLMLDEPTNHLDLNAVIWLEDYLQRWKKTLLVVSHDQDFLNTVCGEMLHIEDLKLAYYKGDYDQFKKEQATRLKQKIKAWEKQEKKLRSLKSQGQSRAKAAESVKKNSKREPGARSKKKMNDAIASGTAAAEVVELVKRPREYAVKLEFAEVAELSRPVMEVTNVKFRYGEKHPIIFDNLDFGIDMDSRICVVGPNGAGKSTLLKLLTGEIDPTTGDVRRNPRLRMGIYNQHFVDRLPMGKTPVEHLRDRFEDEDYQSIRNRLGKYGLEGHAHEVVMRDLSGGQKARVVFVELSLQRPHILLLDEPTNNLDIETIDALIEAINEFNGGIVVVTHDQRLIEYCDCTLWVVEKRAATKWEAGFENYKESLLKEMEDKIEKENAIRQEKIQAAIIAREQKMARIAAKANK